MAESSRPMRPMVHHLHSLSGAKRARKTLPQKWRRTQRSRRPARASRCRSAIVPPLHPLVGISADVEDCGPGACPRARARCRALMGPRQRQRWPLAGAALPRRGGRAVLDEGSTGPADEAVRRKGGGILPSFFLLRRKGDVFIIAVHRALVLGLGARHRGIVELSRRCG